jgi:23S rRNA (cytidine1920-2'-O)/16S rRNA (cytidine1409-2'-O)-methyltransferase
VPKTRADVLLHERELAPTRAKAQALILAGAVFTGDRRVDKAGEKLDNDAPLSVRGQDHPFVSRGGVKLLGALTAFHYDPSGVVAADFGSSTGGFTDCLLQHGAERVYAIDVGYGQLHNKLRQDARVISMERTNARHLDASSLPEAVSLVVIDASFIGLEKLLPAAYAVLADEGDVLAMVKPQFQVGRQQLGKGGVVRDPLLRQQAVDDVARAAEALGFQERHRADAPIKGPKGNHEAFLWLRKSSAPVDEG